MVEVISYFKCVCPKTLIVKAGFLNSEQINWYKKLFVNGLGEFFYTNNIVSQMNEKTFIDIKVECKNINKEEIVNDKNKVKENMEGNLIPVGGGKDSIVTLDMLKNDQENNTCYVVNLRQATRETIAKAGYQKEQEYEAVRILDTKIIELKKEGYLNGHTPFSAILAFSSYLVATMLKKRYIVLSNESSANESNIAGTNINHQYSKSIEFEKDFREYESKYLSQNGPEYFSILRPLTEWQIVESFSELKKYFKIFKSCNVGSVKDIWCENCPKCMYVYIMLKAFLPSEELKQIFTKDMLNEEKYESLLMGLIHQDYNKPFECVGTKEEINLAIDMIIKESLDNGENLPLILSKYVKTKNKNLNLNNIDERIKLAKSAWNKENYLPEKFEEIVKKYIWGK